MVRVKADCIDLTTFRPQKFPPQALAMIKRLTTPYFVRTLFCFTGEQCRRYRKYPIEGCHNDVLMFAGASNKPHHLELPEGFLRKDDDDEIQPFITLRGFLGDVSQVTLRIDDSDPGRLKANVAQGWCEFCEIHVLRQGDLLLFSVVEKSKFVVSVFSQDGNLLVERRLVPPPPKLKRKYVRRVKGSTPRKQENQGGKRKQQGRKRKLLDPTETEVMKLLEEMARTIDGQRVAWEKLENYSTMSIDKCMSPDLAMDFPASPPLGWASVNSNSEEPLWLEEPLWAWCSASAGLQ